uniref:Retinol dehydrogenase 13 n=1 Tax=Arion vulgaris TaxID=1028688 RepID=A0A0B7ANX9_9EUPU
MALSTYLVPLALIGSLIGATRLLGVKRECTRCTDVAIVLVVGGLVLLKKYMAGGQYSGNATIKGKTVIITGANTGIGLETAKELAKRGGRVILACRDTVKGEAVRKAIVEETGNNNVILKKLDLTSFASIKAFAKDINESESHLEILINNAGVMAIPKTLTEDGIEMQFGVNHIGHFLLTQLLLDKIKASAPSRILNVSSSAHLFGKINFDDLNSAKSYSKTQAYFQSKLANVLHARELSRRLEGTGVTANSLHPGAVNTELTRHVPFIDGTFLGRILVLPIRYFIFKTTFEGAQTSIRLAVDPALETVTGKYFRDCKIVSEGARAKDDEVAKRLWTISEAWIKGNID